MLSRIYIRAHACVIRTFIQINKSDTSFLEKNQGLHLDTLYLLNLSSKNRLIQYKIQCLERIWSLVLLLVVFDTVFYSTSLSVNCEIHSKRFLGIDFFLSNTQ
jgi:hypothetical protein